VAVRRTAGWGLAQRLIDCCENLFEVLIDLVVPESQHAKSLPRKAAVASSVPLRMIIQVVLSAIDFDNEPMLQADEVDNETIPGSLTSEMKTAFAP
jgi:hypothetical protein